MFRWHNSHTNWSMAPSLHSAMIPDGTAYLWYSSAISRRWDLFTD